MKKYNIIVQQVVTKLIFLLTDVTFVVPTNQKHVNKQRLIF